MSKIKSVFSGLNLKRAVILFNALFFVLLYTAVFAFVWENYYNNSINYQFFKNGNIILYLIYATLFFIIMELYGGFKIGTRRITDISFTQSLSVIISDTIIYFQICLIAHEMLTPVPLLISIPVVILLSLLWDLFVNKSYTAMFPPEKIILVYGSSSARSIVIKMSKRFDRYLICNCISSTEDINTITGAISGYEAAIICDTENKIRNDILKFCFKKHIQTYIIPKISDIIIRGADEMHILDTPMLLCRNYGINLEQRLIKRAVDILLALIAIIIASPVMLAVAIAVKAYDGGAVFYKQERLTINRRIFKLYKFRSMIQNAEADGVARLAADHDKRITPVGAFIRKTRLDELPQLFNILGGSMTFVGPRPERPEIAEEYEKDMPEFAFRLNVKAGLTGYAQVNGKYNTTAYDKLKLDMMYIENYSLVLDLKLIFLTVKTVFIAESTEGIDENAINAMDLSYKDDNREKL